MRSFLCFDIETCPQAQYTDPGRVDRADLDERWLAEVGDGAAVEAAIAAGEAVLASTGRPAGLHWTTCHVVGWVASWRDASRRLMDTVMHLNSDGKCTAVGPSNDLQVRMAEAALVKRALQLVAGCVNKGNLLVTFNGKAFDLPVLRGRAVVLGLQPPPRVEWEKQLLYPWNNRDHHCDLRLAIGGDKWARGTQLWLANACGISASEEGARVWQLVREGRWDDLTSYSRAEGRTMVEMYEVWAPWI